ncbi:MAG: c-type cytochrome [Planctomycetota bacterium]|nr:c-type cytochrome [Planctomycetota bacterium]
MKCLLCLLLCPLLCLAAAWDGREIPAGLPAEEVERAQAATEAQVELGRRLFFDPVLSSDRTVACASCHKPDHGFADTEPFSTGVAGRLTTRNAPTLYNRVLGRTFMWDGRAQSLEEQVLLPIANELEMDLSVDEAVARLAADEAYSLEFEAAFGGPPTGDRLAAALAGFVRGILKGDSRFDRFRAGERDMLTRAERGGMWLFESRGGCWRCHSGPNFTDEDFHNTGVGAVDGVSEDGRQGVTGEAEDRGRFKTPTLRGLLDTAPYMHDGSLATLAEVVEHYRRGGRANGNLDPHVKPIEMSDEDAANLVAFLEALSGG